MNTIVLTDKGREELDRWKSHTETIEDTKELRYLLLADNGQLYSESKEDFEARYGSIGLSVIRDLIRSRYVEEIEDS